MRAKGVAILFGIVVLAALFAPLPPNNISGSLGPFLGSMLVAAMALWIAEDYTKRVKIIDSELEFSKRYQELFELRHTLNREFRYPTTEYPKTYWSSEAENWYRRFFDLLLNEFKFYEKGFVDANVFTVWMRWAHLNYNDSAFETCGMTYELGWNWWSGKEDADNRLINRAEPIVAFLEDYIYAVPNDSGDTRIPIERAVRQHLRSLRIARLPVFLRSIGRWWPVGPAYEGNAVAVVTKSVLKDNVSVISDTPGPPPPRLE
jgi:hypothetical protein